MQKTKKSISKRFKVTGSGKVMRRTPGLGHLLRNKTTKQRRRARADKLMSEAFASTIKYAISPGR